MASVEVKPPTYPERWEADVVLKDGGTVHIRPVIPGDAGRVKAFHERQSSEAIYFRYFSPMPRLSSRELDRLVKVDYVTHMSFVAMLGDEIVGMAGYDIWRDALEAEVAFIVDEAHRGRGLATVLLEYLVVAARENGLERLVAQVLPSNRRMLTVFQQAGFEASSRFEEGVVEVHLGLEPSATATAAIEERARMAEARSVERLLNPGSIAVIGAGRMPGGLGHEVFRHLVSHGFDGPVYPVNPHGGHVASVRAYPSVLDVIDEVDLAIVAVPAARVADVVDECARKRVRGLVIISAGLDDLEVDGTSGSKFIVERALRSGMRVIGPESMGIINTAAGVSMHSTFAEVHVTPGGVGFLTESGTLGAAALEHAHRMGVGISAFVDIGARTDVSGNDLLQFWETDDRTSVVLLYMESFGNPRKFTRIARRMTRSKPIVAVKSGRGRPAPGAPGEDDAALAAMWPADATVGALLAQSGVIRVDTPAELFNMARVLVHQPVPHGRRVAVISNSNGASVLTTDACTGAGLEIPGLTAATRDALAGQVPPDASLVNPIDLTWEAGPDEYEAAVRAALADDEIDAAIVVYAPPIRERWVDVARAIGTAQSEQDAKPVLATFLGAEIGLPFVSGARAVPLFEFPDEAARVLGHMAEYAAWRSQPEGSTIRLDDSELEPLRGFVSGVLEINPDGCWLDRADTDRLFGLAGLRVAAHRLVRTCAEAVEAANEIGWPVALKATGVERYHRGEGGGVALDLHEDAALVAAHDRMVAALGEAMEIALVQEMVPPGVDVMVAAHQNASFGAVISIGIGGVMAPANRDLGVRVLPLSDTDGTRLIAASPVSALLEQEDAHGDATRAATELLTRLGAVVDQVPEIADVLLNPVIVGGTGACIVDALVRIAPYGVENLPEVRRLT